MPNRKFPGDELDASFPSETMDAARFGVRLPLSMLWAIASALVIGAAAATWAWAENSKKMDLVLSQLNSGWSLQDEIVKQSWIAMHNEGYSAPDVLEIYLRNRAALPSRR